MCFAGVVWSTIRDRFGHVNRPEEGGGSRVYFKSIPKLCITKPFDFDADFVRSRVMCYASRNVNAKTSKPIVSIKGFTVTCVVKSHTVQSYVERICHFMLEVRES